MKNFKSICPIEVTHERGVDYINLCGEVIEIGSKAVKIKEAFNGYIAEISVEDFYKFNKFSN